MNTQTEAFPRTTLEVLTELSGIHHADLESAMKALDKLSDDEEIAKRYDKAESRVATCRALVAAIDQAVVRERERLTGDSVRSVAQTAVDIVNSGALDTEGLTVTASLSGVDPVTGEVADTGHVIASRPDGEEVRTEVGSRTRYGELVADWYSDSGYTGPLEDFQVRGEEDGIVRANGMPIQPSDYGAVLIVEAVA